MSCHNDHFFDTQFTQRHGLRRALLLPQRHFLQVNDSTTAGRATLLCHATSSSWLHLTTHVDINVAPVGAPWSAILNSSTELEALLDPELSSEDNEDEDKEIESESESDDDVSESVSESGVSELDVSDKESSSS